MSSRHGKEFMPARPPRKESQHLPPSEDPKEHKIAEVALLGSQERWRSVFENSAIGVALADLTGRLLAVNSTYKRMLGYTEEEFQTLSRSEEHRVGKECRSR